MAIKPKTQDLLAGSILPQNISFIASIPLPASAICSVPGSIQTRSAILLTALLALLATPSWALNCTTQAGLQPADREALLASGGTLAGAVAGQNFDLLQSSLLPAVTGDWEGIRAVAQRAKPLLQGGNLRWGDAYLLDATDLKAPSDTQFFCTNADSQTTITINLHSLPPGRYALMIGDYETAPLAGQLALILGVDPSDKKWKLGGLFAHEGALDGHDGVWYWTHARELAGKKDAWSAWFSYDAARWLLLPVDFLSSPHLEKLNREQTQTGSNPSDSLPFTVTNLDGSKAWKITALHFDTTLHTADLALVYEGVGLTDQQAARAEAISVMSGLLKLHPELRESFHGLWAYSEKDGRQSYAIELAMPQIP
jgi:hypothetical protein